MNITVSAQNINKSNYLAFKGNVIKNTFSPINAYKYFKIYGESRKHMLPSITGLIETIGCMLSNKRLKIIKDSGGGILCGYSYKIKNKNLHIDTIARNKKSALNDSAHIKMSQIYSDIKSTAVENKADEISLLSYAAPTLKKHYESLGFKENREYIEKFYSMSVNVDDFCKNK